MITNKIRVEAENKANTEYNNHIVNAKILEMYSEYDIDPESNSYTQALVYVWALARDLCKNELRGLDYELKEIDSD